MADENGTNQGNTEEQQTGRGNQASDKVAEKVKEVGSVAAALAEQGAKAAKKKFEEAGGVDGIKDKGRKAAGEIKAGFVPDEGTTGYRRYTSSLKNLWVSGRTGKIAIVVGIILILYFVGSCFDDSSDMKEIKRSSSGRKLADSSISERATDNTTSTRTTNTSAKKGFTVKADIKVGAEDLWQDFSENVVGAEEKYSGKCIAVLGKVAVIRGDNKSAMVCLVGNNSLVGAGVIACIMKHDEINKVAMLTKGDQVEITGTCGDKRYLGFIEGIEFSNCVITSVLDSSISRDPRNIIEEPVTVSVLVREHRDNEIVARQKYDGKKFVFTGKVIKIDRDFAGNSYVLMGGTGEMCDIFCYMAANSEDVLTSINRGKYIKLRGVCQSSSCGLSDPIRFSDCVMLQ